MNVIQNAMLLIAGLITACSSSQTTPPFEEYLATNIRSDGSKEFYYTATLSKEDGATRGAGNNVKGGMRVKGGSSSNTNASAGISVGSQNGGRGSQRGGKHGQRVDEKLSEQLEKMLLASGYCREGYMEQERHILTPTASIRGECNETASDQDYKNFPNSEDTSG